jgi:mono/diheme cytochrome c family protein
MRWTRWIVVAASSAVVFAALSVASCSAPQPPAAQQKTEMTLEEKIARGRVISWSSGCNDCHTPGTFYGAPDTTRLLSGSELGWKGPWGVTYPRNLTPDSTTGIASWTEDQIITAFRQGHRPDGTPLLPPMPWPAFSRMSDDDAHALAAFIKSLPPVHHKAPDVIPPGGKATGPMMVFPPPPAWDGKNLPPPPAAASGGGGK